jgi:hypothetical protein
MARKPGSENLGSKFAQMSEEERRRYALEQDDPVEAPGDELELEDPRRDHTRTKADQSDRDGAAAQLDERQHERRVDSQARRAARRDRSK